jgi:hypothetical protein
VLGCQLFDSGIRQALIQRVKLTTCYQDVIILVSGGEVMRSYEDGFVEYNEYCRCGHTLESHDPTSLSCREYECECQEFSDTREDQLDAYYDHKLHAKREGD